MENKYLFGATEFSNAIIEYGKGSFVWDTEGKRYLDLNCGQFCTVFGHAYEPLNEVVVNQIKKITHTNTMQLSTSVMEAAKLMAEINDQQLSKTIFLSTGAEANECALRYVKFITGKEKVLYLEQGYHGLTLATQSITMGGEWARPKVQGSIGVMTPDMPYRPEGMSESEFIEICIKDIEDKIEKNRGEIAAFFVEPILGAGGMVILPKAYLEAVRKICDENDIVLIFDECQTGFGRTGEWFAYQHYNVVPDILVCAKAMGAGFPVSSVTFKRELAARIEGKISHFSSHQNDPLACEIVCFVINTIKNNKVLEGNKEKGKYILERLKEIEKESKILTFPRGIGLMMAFDINIKYLGDNRETTRALIKSLEKDGVILQAIKKGVTFRILPNYLTSYEEIDYFIETLKKNILDIEKTL